MPVELTRLKCKPCEGGALPMTPKEIKTYAAKLKTPWQIIRDKRIRQEFVFHDFKEAMKFVNKVADLAEADDHHPTIRINYRRVTLELWTHAIGGLSENDFIVAAKVEKMVSTR